MSLDLTAASSVEHNESASDGQALKCTPTPTIETLFDVIQVCEISLRVASRHQFEAWVRGPLNSLIPHSGLIVWTHSHDGGSSDLAAIKVASCGGTLSQLSGKNTIWLGSDLRRQWLMAERVPLLLNAGCVSADLLPRIPEDVQIVIHGVEPLFGGAGNLFALGCDSRQDFAQVLFMTQLIAPYLQLAVQRLDSVADASGGISPVRLRPTSLEGLTVREIEVLECMRDGKTNAEIGSVLNISPFTVKSHLQRMFRKLKVSTRTQAVATALSLKVLDHGNQRTRSFRL
jgi:transcriptional regulator EpsA